MRFAIAVSFESDGEIEAEIKSYLKMGWFKTGTSFQMIIYPSLSGRFFVFPAALLPPPRGSVPSRCPEGVDECPAGVDECPAGGDEVYAYVS